MIHRQRRSGNSMEPKREQTSSIEGHSNLSTASRAQEASNNSSSGFSASSKYKSRGTSAPRPRRLDF